MSHKLVVGSTSSQSAISVDLLQDAIRTPGFYDHSDDGVSGKAHCSRCLYESAHEFNDGKGIEAVKDEINVVRLDFGLARGEPRLERPFGFADP